MSEHQRFWQEIIYKSLIPIFDKHTVMMTNKPKVGINFYKLSLARIFSVHSCQNLFLVSLLFVALLDPFYPYSPFKFLIFYLSSTSIGS